LAEPTQQPTRRTSGSQLRSGQLPMQDEDSLLDQVERKTTT
jgi:hypothetical protein